MKHTPTIALAVAGLAAAAAVRSGQQLALARRELRQARRAALHDPLTGLLNRAGLHAAWIQLATAQRTVAVLDLDGFKPVNDMHGHATGDHILVTVAGRLRSSNARAAARLGGDEFALILTGDARPDDIAARVARPIPLPSGAVVTVHASVGVASRRGSLAELLADADAAMYRAKATRCTVAVFTRGPDDRPTLATDPRPAIRVRDLAYTDAPTHVLELS